MRAYKDSVGVLTIGYGHTGPDVKAGMKITQDMANSLLAVDLKEASKGVMKLTLGKCTQGQLDALTDFAFNLGVHALANSTLLKFHNQGKYDLAADQFHLWVHAGGKILPGLVTRRAKEKELYLKGK